MNSDRSILVTGDFICDRHIYEGRRHHFCDKQHRGVHVVEELGGAALIHYILTKLERGVASHLSVAVDEKRRPILPDAEAAPPELSAYAVWRPFGSGRDTASEKLVWRTDDAMGFGCLSESSPAFKWPKADSLPTAPDVVVLSDGGMGFRSNPGSWPGDGILKKARWIVLKTTYPLSDGPLWTRLSKTGIRSKLVLVLSASDLRRGTARISSGLSWDATVESVLQTLKSSGEYEDLARCRHLIVTFGTEGGLWLEMGKTFAASRVHLVYDAKCVEEEHEKPKEGKAFGALSCLTAAVAWRLALDLDKPAVDLEAALEGGLSAMFDLLKNGHGPAMAPGEGFPAKRLAESIKTATCEYARSVFAAPAPLSGPMCGEGKTDGCWSIMHEALHQQGQQCPDPAWVLAERVARNGPVALGSLPHLSIGNLISADRREIESLRALRQLILEYRDRPNSQCRKPLSIGVFGPPGAGKSFAVKEIAQALIGKEGWLEFNLSQFREDTTEDLIGAFHQIRDRVLRAQLPVAFFDEFDARNCAWLQYLLAPMQDGAFQEGQITHPIGKCIFIFAGATSRTFESFGAPEKSGAAFDAFRMTKGPDFKSRLDGFLNIMGPNRREVVTVVKNGGSYAGVYDPCDIFYPIRRALIIRAELRCRTEDKLRIDDGLLKALLRIDTYKHGARSIGKLVEPFKKAYPGTICRSLLPPPQQMNLHVDNDAFVRAYENTVPPSKVEKLRNPESVAMQIHETYRRLGLEQGWIEKDGKKDVEYDKVHDFYKQSNLEAAHRMVTTLALAGLRLEKGRNTAAEREAVKMRIEYNLELMAEAEHAGWMDWHLNQGWQYGPQKPANPPTQEPDIKKHPCLRPYLKLSGEERHKDRDAVRHYPDFAEAAGMKIVMVCGRASVSNAAAKSRATRAGKKR